MKNLSNSVDRIKKFKTFKLYNKINRKSINEYQINAQRSEKEKTHQKRCVFLRCRRRPIFPGSCPPSIFSTRELNYRVRDGNGWTLSVINTD